MILITSALTYDSADVEPQGRKRPSTVVPRDDGTGRVSRRRSSRHMACRRTRRARYWEKVVDAMRVKSLDDMDSRSGGVTAELDGGDALERL